MPRRLATILLLCLAVSGAGATNAGADADRPASAEAFVDSVGVNIHSTFLDTPYTRLDRVLGALDSLGVRHVRDGLLPPSTEPGLQSWQRFYFSQLAAHRIEADLILGSPGDGVTSVPGLVGELGRLPSDFVESVEGPNEYDLSGRARWPSELRAYQRRLYTEVRDRPSLASLPVLAPSFGNPGNAWLPGDLGRWSDADNVHSYPGGLAPGAAELRRSLGRRVAPGDASVFATETGYHNALDDQSGHPPVSERVAGAYIPRLLLESFASGIERTYLYELVDQGPDPRGEDRERNFGLFHYDFSPKPAAIAVGRLISLLVTHDPGVRARPPEYRLSGDTGGVRHLLLRRANGSFALVLWRDTSIWDRTARRELQRPDRRVRLRLDRRSSIRAFDLLDSGAQSRRQRANRLRLTIPADDATVVVIGPRGR